MKINRLNRLAARASLLLIWLSVVLPRTEAVIVGVKSRGADSPNYIGPARLFTFNEDGSGVTDLAEIQVPYIVGGINVNGMAWSSTYGILAYQWSGSSQLIQISTNGANFNISGGILTAQPVGLALSGVRIMGATFDLQDRLWVVDDTLTLRQINPTNGAVIGSPVSITGTSASSAVGDLAVRQDGTMFLTVYSGNYYTLNPATGVATLQFTEFSASPDYRFNMGMAFSAANSSTNQLYVLEGNGPDDLLLYNTSTWGLTVLDSDILAPDSLSWSQDLAGLVPEPTSIVLAGLGGLLILIRRR
jgi:PEP-CTERM motif